jgi:D-alanine-D-alanine ligase
MIKVAILTGGESAEREIALQSSEFIHFQAKRFFEVKVFDFPKELALFIKERQNYALAIPVFHGRGGEDGQIQGFLQTLKVPYIFSGIDGHSVGINKIFTKQITRALGVKQAAYKTAKLGEKVEFIVKSVVKPYDSGSSVGVVIVANQQELDQAVAQVLKVSQMALIENYLDGEEYTVGVVEESGRAVALPVIQIKPGNVFFDFESKYHDGKTVEICPAPIPSLLAKKLQKIALQVHSALDLKHMSRSDFIVVNNEPYFLEVNTIPGLTKNSLIPKAVRSSGRDFGLLLKGWVESTLTQHSR